MRLVDLSPCWLLDDVAGNRRWFMFRSPSGHRDWISCKTFPMGVRQQLDFIYRQARPDLVGTPVVASGEDMCWTVAGSFGDLTVSPSLDFSASGNWHGFIRGGEIAGGY